MARGGYRPGAGRPKLTEAEKAERKILRAAGIAVPPKRASKPKSKAKKPAPPVAPEVPADVQVEALAADATPLDYMLTVMRNPGIEAARRDRMAIAAAPFVHARREGEAPGKREVAANAATKASKGRFAAPPMPLKLVSGK